MFHTRAKVLLEKLVSVSQDAGRSAAQDSAKIMDSRMSDFKDKLTFVRWLYSDDHRNRDIFSVYCSFSSCINPNAGNCSIGYSLPPRQLPWTKNVPFHLAQIIF